MVVGEPSLMGGEFGDEDERVITRLENNQYDSSTVPTNGLDENVDYGSSLGPPNSNQPPQTQNQQQQQQSQPNQVPPNQQSLNQPSSVQASQQQQLNQPPSNQPGNNQLNNSNGQQSIQGNGVSNPAIEDKKPSPISQ